MLKRWGIVGYGWVARDYMVPAIQAAGGQLVAVADPKLPHDLPGIAGAATPFANVEDLLNGSACDMIYVATPNNAHAEAVCQIAARRIPVLCEKPLAATLHDAERMAAHIDSTGTLYGTAFDQRHHPAHQAMRAAIRTGAIGEPIAIRIVYACWLDPDWNPTGQPAHEAPKNWRIDRRIAGGGAVIDLAPHGLDLAQYLIDQPITDLTIMLQHRIHGYDVDDGGMLMAHTPNDVLISLHVAYNCKDSLPRRRLEVMGATGMITAIDTMGQAAGGTLTHICGRTGHMAPIPFDEAVSPFVNQVMAFSAAASGHPHDFSMSRDIALTRQLDAAYRKAQSCR